MSGVRNAIPMTLADERLPSSVRKMLDDRDALSLHITPDGDFGPSEENTDEDPQDDSGGEPAFLRGEFDENLAEHLDDYTLNHIASDLIQGIEADIQSRRDWEDITVKAIEYLGLKLETASGEASSSEATVAKVYNTLMLEAAIYFWANAHAELLPSVGPCKVKNDTVPDPTPLPPAPPPPPPPPQGAPPSMAGAPPPGGPPLGASPPPLGIGHNGGPNSDDLAQAFETDMNHYLTVVDRQYYRDFSRMLFSLGPMGTEFRKVYWCPLRRRPVSEWVKGQNLIVSNEAADLTTAGRITERIMMRHATVKRLQFSGWWRDLELSAPMPEPTQVDKAEAATVGISLGQTISADFRHTIYESYVDLDLEDYEHSEDGKKTGLPLPYRVTMDKDSRKVLEIRRNWKKGDINFTARRRYVMYGMIPGLGFYYLGFIHTLGNTQRALTAMERQIIDAGSFASFPGFLFKKGAIRQDTNQIRVPPGGGQEVNTGDQPISNVIMPLPYKDISAGLLKMMETLSSDGRKLSSIAEMPVGEGRADVPVGTVVAMIEQTTKVMAAVHKGLHAAMQDELLLLKEQFAEDPQALWMFAKSPQRKWEQAQEFEDLNLVPASDPNIPSQLHRIMLNTALIQITEMAQGAAPGLLDIKEVLSRAFRTLNVPDWKSLFNPNPPGPMAAPGAPPPDPTKMMSLQLDALEQRRKAASEAATDKLQRDEMAARIQSESQDRDLKIELARQDTIQEQLRMTAELHKDREQRDADAAKHITGLVAEHHQHRTSLASEKEMHDNEIAVRKDEAKARAKAAAKSKAKAKGAKK